MTESSIFTHIYNTLLTYLPTVVPDIRFIAQDFGQLEAELRPKVSFPCLLLDFENTTYSDVSGNVQIGEGVMLFRLATNPYSDDSNLTPETTRAIAINYYDLEAQLHIALQQWTDDYFGYVTRVSATTEKRGDDLLRVRQLRYSFTFKDDSAFHQEVMTVKPELKLTTELETGAATMYSYSGNAALFSTALNNIGKLWNDYSQNESWNDLIRGIFEVGVYMAGAEDHFFHPNSAEGYPVATALPANVGMRSNLDEIFYFTESTAGAYNLQGDLNDTGVDFLPVTIQYAKAHSMPLVFTLNVCHGTVEEAQFFLDYLVAEDIEFIIRYGNEQSIGATSSEAPDTSQTSEEYLSKVALIDDMVTANYPGVARIINAARNSTDDWINEDVVAFAIVRGIPYFTQYLWLDAGSNEEAIADYFDEAILQMLASLEDEFDQLADYMEIFAGLKMHVGQFCVSLQRTGYIVQTITHGIAIWKMLFHFFRINHDHDGFIASAVFLVNESAVDRATSADNNFDIPEMWTSTDDDDNKFVKRVPGLAYEMLKELASDEVTFIPVTVTGDDTVDAVAFLVNGVVKIYACKLSDVATVCSITLDGDLLTGDVSRTTAKGSQPWASIGASPAYSHFDDATAVDVKWEVITESASEVNMKVFSMSVIETEATEAEEIVLNF